MPLITNYSIIPITNAGGVVSIDLAEPYQYYTINGSGIGLLSSFIVNTTGTATKGMTINVRYTGNGLDSDTSDPCISVQILGVTLTDTQALGKANIISTYNGASWDTFLQLSFDDTDIVDTNNIEALAISTAKIDNLAVTTAKIDNLAVTAAKIAANTITAVQIAPGTITATEIATRVIDTTLLTPNLTLRTIIFPVSFETGEVGDFKIMMGEAGTLDVIYAYAYKAIAATDNATIVPKNNAGTTMATGTITFTASDARGTAYTVNPSTNNTFIAGDILTFTCAKATVGGRAMLSLDYTIA